jgi:hypothetical protein
VLVLSSSPSTAKSRGKKSKNRQVELHQTKKFLQSKGRNQQNKKATMEWKEIFANYVSDKVLISKIYKQLLHFNSEKTLTT